MNRVRNPYDIIVIDGKRYQAIPTRHGCPGCAFLDMERERKYGFDPCSLAFNGGHADISCVLAACNVIFKKVE